MHPTLGGYSAQVCDAHITFIEADAAIYPISAGAFDIISCIGATWIGGGLVGTLERMRPWIAPGASSCGMPSHNPIRRIPDGVRACIDGRLGVQYPH